MGGQSRQVRFAYCISLLFLSWRRESAMAVCAVLGQPRDCLAGLYHRETIIAPDVDDSGFAKALDIDTFLTMVNIVKKTDNPKSDVAEAALRSIQERQAKLASLGPEEQ